MLKLCQSIFLIFIVQMFMTSCGGMAPGAKKYSIAPDLYKQIYSICLQHIDKNSPEMVITCDGVAFKRTKFRY